MTLTFKLDLDIRPLDLHTEIQVCMSVRLAVRVVTDRQTHTHTDTQTMSKLLHPTRHIRDVGCKNSSQLILSVIPHRYNRLTRFYIIKYQIKIHILFLP